MKSSNPLIVARIKQYASILIWTTGIILGVRQLGLSTDILILLMGLTGLAFIVSAVYVLQNSVSRSVLNLNIQYKVGDVISIKNFSGKVIEITSLNTILLDKEGKLIAVPNVRLCENYRARRHVL
jgi:small-conductance mechanosensitive channel